MITMPEQQLKTPLRSYGKEIGRVQKPYKCEEEVGWEKNE
jgi:hypothetical protein